MQRREADAKAQRKLCPGPPSRGETGRSDDFTSIHIDIPLLELYLAYLHQRRVCLEPRTGMLMICFLAPWNIQGDMLGSLIRYQIAGLQTLFLRGDVNDDQRGHAGPLAGHPPLFPTLLKLNRR
jgi:hypothetical protein